MSRLKTGGYAPLFDRLEQSADNDNTKIGRWLDTGCLEKSVFKELNRITQTRSRLTFFEFLNKKNLSFGEIMPILRVIVSGIKFGPPLNKIFFLLGKKEVISRIKFALNNF